MATRRAWVLNLDADLELGAAGGYAPTRRVTRAMQPHICELSASLLAPDDLLVDDDSPAGIARGLEGLAFCPTPRALRLLTRAGALPRSAPPVSVLRRVNAREFAAMVGPTLPGTLYVSSLDAALTCIAGDPAVSAAWRVKTRFGMAGRGQRVVGRGPLDAADLAFVAAGLAAGGLLIEPNVDLVEEYGLHGDLSHQGELTVGNVVRQECDARGAWRATHRATHLPEDVLVTLRRQLQVMSTALTNAGYFGPFGIDAYTYRDAAGTKRLQPLGELNARYSMGFAIGFGRP